MRRLVALTALVLMMFTGTATAGVPGLLKPLRHMQLVMHMKVAKKPPARHWFNQVWEGFNSPPHKQAWLCIHRFEGSWADPNPPYYGGLQMDLSFQKTYGPYLYRTKGTANHWTPTEQMWVAEHAYRVGRGFYPWPNTARYCHLI